MFGLQYDNYEVIEYELQTLLSNYFGDRIGSFTISGQRNKPFVALHMEFTVYNFYNIILNYERGSFGCAIRGGNNIGIALPNSQKWYEQADLDVFVKELDKEIRLRIPDKYLEHYGWL